MFKKYKLPIILAGLFFLVCLPFLGKDDKPLEGEMLGASFSDANWNVTSGFQGYQTKSDPSKVSDGANPMGQNTTSNNGDRISIRNTGYELFPAGTASTSESKVTSLHTFRMRDGENVMMRSHGTVLEYYEEGNDEWTTLQTGLSDGAEFDFADYNINTDMQSYVYFGNAVDDFARWSGSHTVLTTALALNDSFVYVDSVDNFLLASSNIIVCGTELAYTSASTTLNRFALTASSTVACDNSSGVAETVATYSSNPKGNIYLVNNNRLFIAGIASTTQAVYFSEYGVATNFVDADLILSTTATAPGIFNLGEGGGAVIGIAKDEESIYFFKEYGVRKATLNDTLYTLEDLKAAKGAVNNKGVFIGGNQVYFTTTDNEILSLGRVESIDYPQTVSISDAILPTVKELGLDSTAGIVFRDKAYFSVKSTPEVNNNDTVFVWDIKNNKWDSPIVGWSVSDFTVYNEDLYISDSISPNVYKVINEAQDGEFEVVASWRSKQYDFKEPQIQKQIVGLYIEGYIAQNTTLGVNLLLNEDGYEQSFSTEIEGTNEDLIYDSTSFNAIGLSPFGTERFGSNADISGKKKFRVYFSEFRANPFYNIQIEFTSEGLSQEWEILNYAMKVRPASVEDDRTLYIPFK